MSPLAPKPLVRVFFSLWLSSTGPPFPFLQPGILLPSQGLGQRRPSSCESFRAATCFPLTISKALLSPGGGFFFSSFVPSQHAPDLEARFTFFSHGTMNVFFVEGYFALFCQRGGASTRAGGNGFSFFLSAVLNYSFLWPCDFKLGPLCSSASMASRAPSLRQDFLWPKKNTFLSFIAAQLDNEHFLSYPSRRFFFR